MNPRYSLGVLALALTTPLALTACGQDDKTSPPSITAPPGDASPAALQTEAAKMMTAVADRDYRSAYQFRSTRCKLKISEADFEAAMQQYYGDRDLKTKPAEYVVSASGTSGFVVTKNFDDRASEDDPTPRVWTFIDGQWRFDNC